jgi:hypothetical protein
MVKAIMHRLGCWYSNQCHFKQLEQLGRKTIHEDFMINCEEPSAVIGTRRTICS